MEYRFKPLGKVCHSTGKPLQPGSICHSVLVEKDGEFLRLDYSDAGWTAAPVGSVGHWRTMVPLPPDPRGLRIDPAALMRYFEQLSEENLPTTDRTRYVAALLLLQRRRLRLEGSEYDGDLEHLVLGGARGEGQFRVPNLDLSPEELEVSQAELRVQLAAEWQT